MLSPKERAELREVLEEQAADLVELTAGVDVADLERAACLSALRMLADDAPPESAELFVDALETLGSPAAGLLAAIAALAPAELASRARVALDRLGVAPPSRPASEVTEVLAVRLPGADAYLLRLERDGPAWQAAHLIIEGDGEEATLVAASMGMPEVGGDLADAAGELDAPGIAAIEPADRVEVAGRLSAGAERTRRLGLGVGLETVACLPIIGAALGLAPESVCGLSPAGAPSSLVVELDDEARFAQVSDDLIDRCSTWLARHGRPVEIGELAADLMLTFKWAEGDGDLARWTEDDLARFLLDHVPREVFVDERMLAELPEAMVGFLDFLDDEGLRAGPPLAELESVCEDLREPFAEAIAQAPDRGLADRLLRAMVADGVDPSDEAQVQSWIARYNAGTQAEREAITGRSSASRAKKHKRRAAKASRKRNRRR
jgi:hypothetical protein